MSRSWICFCLDLIRNIQDQNKKLFRTKNNGEESKYFKKIAQQDWISFEAAFNASTNNRKIM